MELITSQATVTPIYLVNKIAPATVQLHMGGWSEIISRAYIRIFPLLCLYEIGITWIAHEFGNGHCDIATLVLEGWPSIL